MRKITDRGYGDLWMTARNNNDSFVYNRDIIGITNKTSDETNLKIKINIYSYIFVTLNSIK